MTEKSTAATSPHGRAQICNDSRTQKSLFMLFALHSPAPTSHHCFNDECLWGNFILAFVFSPPSTTHKTVSQSGEFCVLAIVWLISNNRDFSASKWHLIRRTCVAWLSKGLRGWFHTFDTFSLNFRYKHSRITLFERSQLHISFNDCLCHCNLTTFLDATTQRRSRKSLIFTPFAVSSRADSLRAREAESELFIEIGAKLDFSSFHSLPFQLSSTDEKNP